MTYIDGLVIPVLADRKSDYQEVAAKAAPIFLEQGALEIVECLGDDVPHGKVTDFYRAVDARENETVVFSWVVWPSKETRDAGNKKALEDPRMQPGPNAPFDMKRLIYGGFQPLFGTNESLPRDFYIDGFVVPVPSSKREAYLRQAAEALLAFREYGVLGLVECWGDDVPHGKLTDFYRAVDAREDEKIVFSWMIWPSRAVREEGSKRMADDPRLQPKPDWPFDGKRVIYGGFTPILRTGEAVIIEAAERALA